jgi:hypothetical protein
MQYTLPTRPTVQERVRNHAPVRPCWLAVILLLALAPSPAAAASVPKTSPKHPARHHRRRRHGSDEHLRLWRPEEGPRTPNIDTLPDRASGSGTSGPCRSARRAGPRCSRDATRFVPMSSPRSLLAAAGYESALFGKFHIAGSDNNPFGGRSAGTISSASCWARRTRSILPPEGSRIRAPIRADSFPSQRRRTCRPDRHYSHP